MGVYRVASRYSALSRPHVASTKPGHRRTFTSLITTQHIHRPPTVESETTASPLASTITAFSPNAQNFTSNPAMDPHSHSPKKEIKLDTDSVATTPALLYATIQVLARQHLRETETTSLNMGPKSPEISLAGSCQIVKDNAGMTIGVFRQGTALSQLIECALLMQDHAALSTDPQMHTVPAPSPSTPTVVPVDPSVQIVSPDLHADVLAIQPTMVHLPSPVTATDKATLQYTPEVVAGSVDPAKDALQPSPGTPTATPTADAATKHPKGTRNGETQNAEGPLVIPTAVESEDVDEDEMPPLIVEDNSALHQMCDMMSVLSLQCSEELKAAQETVEPVHEAISVAATSHAAHPATEVITLPLPKVTGAENNFTAKPKAKGSMKEKPKKTDSPGVAHTKAKSNNKNATTSPPKVKGSKKEHSSKSKEPVITHAKPEFGDVDSDDDEMPALIVEDHSAIHQLTDMIRVLSLHDAEELKVTNQVVETVDHPLTKDSFHKFTSTPLSPTPSSSPLHLDTNTPHSTLLKKWFFPAFTFFRLPVLSTTTLTMSSTSLALFARPYIPPHPHIHIRPHHPPNTSIHHRQHLHAPFCNAPSSAPTFIFQPPNIFSYSPLLSSSSSTID
ncbi:hypothetical protein FRB94_013166 [Tulasnella sp. JGI-2019a]|nr:hypothetical protein FRB94_013166 [Tulasnella sp. JGI-2019a]